MRIPFKRHIERYTTLTAIYRMIREEWVWRKQQPRTTPYGFTMVGRTDMQQGLFEAEEARELGELLGQADVFVDVGANVGYFTCLARAKGVRSIAIEPEPNNFRYLSANLQLNGWNDVEIWPLGVSGEPGLAALYGGSTGASLVEGWAGVAKQYRRWIAVSTLDILLGNRFEGKRIVIKYGC